jgi:thioredoxin-like negative regulator of GroEL
MEFYTMKSVSPKKLEKVISTNDTVIVQVGSDRCVPCRQQELEFDMYSETFGNEKLTIVKVDVDDHPEIIKKLDLKWAFPVVSVFRNGSPQPLIDSMRSSSKIDRAIYGHKEGRVIGLLQKLSL